MKLGLARRWIEKSKGGEGPGLRIEEGQEERKMQELERMRQREEALRRMSCWPRVGRWSP